MAETTSDDADGIPDRVIEPGMGQRRDKRYHIADKHRLAALLPHQWLGVAVHARALIHEIAVRCGEDHECWRAALAELKKKK